MRERCFYMVLCTSLSDSIVLSAAGCSFYYVVTLTSICEFGDCVYVQ